MNPLAGAIGLLIVVVALDVWVYVDANARLGTSREVTASIGSFTLDTPLVWFLTCVILFVFFFPLYLVARREAG